MAADSLQLTELHQHANSDEHNLRFYLQGIPMLKGETARAMQAILANMA